MKGIFEQKGRPILLKLALGAMFLFINAMLAIAASGTVSSFYGQTNPFNISLIGGINNTYYLPIPRYAYVENLTSSLTLFGNGTVDIFFEFENTGKSSILPYYKINTSISVLNSTEKKFGDYSLNCHGNDLIDISSIKNIFHINQTQFLSFWLYLDENVSQQYMLAGRTIGGKVLYIKRYADGKLEVTFGENAYYGGYLEPYQWNHVALSWNNSRFDIYLNGYYNGTHANEFNGNFGWQHGPTLCMRNDSINQPYFGKMDNLIFGNFSLNQSTVTKLYNNELENLTGIGTLKLYSPYKNIFYNDSKGLNNYAIDFNNSLYNNVLKHGCSCTNCSIDRSNCSIPVYFYSSVLGTLQVNLTLLNYSYGIDNCTSSFGIPNNETALNISYLDNQSNAVTVEHNTFLNYIDSNFSQKDIDIQKESYCIYPSWFNYTIDQEIEYAYQGTIYNYFLNDYLFNNKTKLLNLYVTSGTTQVLFTVLDRGQEVEGAYIHILEYDVGTGTYKTSEIIRTDSQGEAIGNIILGTTFYNFLIYYNGELVYTETGSKLISTTRTFNINLQGTEWLDNFGTTLNVNTNLYYNEATENFVFTWSDSTGDVHYGCLRVDKRNDTGKFTLSDNCTLTTSGTIIYNIAPLNNGTEYIATAYMKYDEEIIIDRISYKVAAVRAYFRERPLPSLFLAWMLTLVLFLIGIPNPVIGITLLGVGVIFTWQLGMIMVPLTQIGAIIILIIIQIYLAGNQS